MPKAARSTKYMTVTAGARFETGCIATFTDGVSRHFVGVNSEATRAVAEYFDTKDVKIVSLSTPSTIHRDLQGTRDSLEDSPANDASRGTINTPEEFMLGAIGRTDLLQPRSGERSGARMDAGSRR